MTIAWNYNKREPRFFSKGTYGKFPESDWKISETMLASAANLLYFYPYSKNISGEPNFYISGDNFAKSPALYAYEVATKLNGEKASNIRVVSIGSIQSLPYSISEQQSVLEWVSYTRDLAAPVKKHSMDYMLDKIMDENKSKFYRYELKVENEWA